MEFQEKLDQFVRKASPRIDAETREKFVHEMLLAIDRWALADPEMRAQEIAKSKPILEKVLGIGANEVGINIEFSKERIQDAKAAQDNAGLYLKLFTTRIEKRRAKEGRSAEQLVFRIGNVDFTHPRLLSVSCVISGEFLEDSRDQKRQRNDG